MRHPASRLEVVIHSRADTLHPADVESKITHMAAIATPGLKPGEVKAIIRQAVRKAGGPTSTRVGHDSRYAYRGHTFCEKLGISAELARDLRLQQMIPESERKRRRAEAERARRAKNGSVSRKEYEENSASRTTPWKRYGLGRSQYYVRKNAGMLPDPAKGANFLSE